MATGGSGSAAVPRSFGVCKIVPGTNINAAALNNVPPLAPLVTIGPVLFDVAGLANEIRCLAAGWIRAEASLAFLGNATRYGARARFTINGALGGTSARTAYIRNASGHLSSSFNLSELILVSAGDLIGLRVDRAAATTAAVLAQDGELSLEYVEVQ